MAAKHLDDFSEAEQALIEKLALAVSERVVRQHIQTCFARQWWGWLAVAVLPGVVVGVVITLLSRWF